MTTIIDRIRGFSERTLGWPPIKRERISRMESEIDSLKQEVKALKGEKENHVADKEEKKGTGPDFGEFRKGLEKTFHLPPIEDVTGVAKSLTKKGNLTSYLQLLKSIPDKETIQEINKLMDSIKAGNFSSASFDIDKITGFLTALHGVDFKGLTETIAQLNILIKELPEGSLDLLKGLLDQTKKPG